MDTFFLKSRLARRIFGMLIICALFPFMALSMVSFWQVSRQLNAQSSERLRQGLKAYCLSIYQRLLYLETDLRFCAAMFQKASALPSIHVQEKFIDEQIKQHLLSLGVITRDKTKFHLLGELHVTPHLSPAHIQHLSAGKAVLYVVDKNETGPEIYMIIALNPESVRAGMIIGQISPGYLWGTDSGNALPPVTEALILDEQLKVLYSSFENELSLPGYMKQKIGLSAFGSFELTIGGQRYLASFRKLFLKPRFFVTGWSIVAAQSMAWVQTPISYFKKTFVLVVMLSLWIVLLLSIYAVRRSLIPLELLKKGVQRIAERDFGFRVNLNSGDEFQDLAEAFNDMAHRLDNQFRDLRAIAEIDKAILSSLNKTEIVYKVIAYLKDCFPCDIVAVVIIDPENTRNDTLYYNFSEAPVSEIQKKEIRLAGHDLRLLNKFACDLDSEDQVPDFLLRISHRPLSHAIMFPVIVQEELGAIVAGGCSKRINYTQEDLHRIKQITNQMAVALSNSRLLEQLDALNWSTLEAFARAVDAKSSWTAGHSYRVTTLALEIAKGLGLDQTQIDLLHRGALLHDIGKIGIPASILDKPERLTEEEYAIIKTHPQVGARILEPIKTYRDIIPIVEQHHEAYNGTGYPYGLSGEQIDFKARILAVADVFDALKSDRPYRKGWPVDKVIEFMKEQAGKQFDPAVIKVAVDVFRHYELESKVASESLEAS